MDRWFDIDQIPIPILLVDGANFVIDQINKSMLILAGTEHDLVGLSLTTALPELANESIWPRIKQVFEGGDEFVGKGIPLSITSTISQTERYFDIISRPLRHDDQIIGVMFTLIETTGQIVARNGLKEAEIRLKSIVAAIPAAICLFIGRDLVIESPNQTFINITGKGSGIEGHPLKDVMPEFAAEQQTLLKILDGVFTTGIPFLSSASHVKVVRDGVLSDNYYNISYTPLRNQNGETYAILDIAIDVTDQVLAHRAFEKAKAMLLGVIEVAEMGVWELDVKTGMTKYSQQFKQLFEFSQDFVEWDQFYQQIHKNDRGRLQAAVDIAGETGSDGLLDEECTIVTKLTGRHRLVRIQARMYLDSQGKPEMLIGSVRDLTENRLEQQALEQLVQERTKEVSAANEELAATNEELAASIEEYAVVNEQMQKSNGLLVRSNESLQTFAYVASHDLQEPLRKIQQFSNMLLERYGNSLGDGVLYVNRMKASADRMSLLISDLLKFSQISATQDLRTPVSLDQLIKRILSDLEIIIQETNAKFTIAGLPTVMGDSSQLNQLFQNLLSNAIKFSSAKGPAERAEPSIAVSYQTLKAANLPERIKPASQAAFFYRIDVSDNGVGFEEKYLDRIFQLFQRLHGKSEFAGTGIGLAICEKVVINHGGAITAQSRLGVGSTFSVYLPVH